MRAYLDNSATTRASEAVCAAVMRGMAEEYANPSSLHSFGQDAQRAVKDARGVIAGSAGVAPAGVIFTSGGTEADNLIFASLMRDPAKITRKRVLISAIEHPAVSAPAERLASLGAGLTRINCQGRETAAPGMVDTEALISALEQGRADLVSVMQVNSEIGTIQPVDEISRIVREFAEGAGGPKPVIHCDAVQAFGKVPLSREPDAQSISAHKIHGPKGVGALCCAYPEKIFPLIFGGGQEAGRRSGTENVPGIAGFAVAAREACTDMTENAEHALRLRTRLLDAIESEIPDIMINSPREASPSGEAGRCSPFILNVSFAGTRGEVIVHDLERDGVFVSTGTACASLGKRNGNHGSVLKSIGLSDAEAEGAIRFSFSRYTTDAEIDYAAEKLAAAVFRFRKTGSLR
ncbi:MAG: cysteine desulfurase [Clostridiales Family XIII bacterium]|nr:cysteine desulfurase [Clostridiales Family XIII bacterium]